MDLVLADFQEVSSKIEGANLFAYEVRDPERFGVVDIGKNGEIIIFLKNLVNHYLT